MRSPKIRPASFALLCVFSFCLGNETNAKPVQPANLGMTAKQQLADCIRIAKQGDVKTAVRRAQQVKNDFVGERLLEVSYINTLVTIVEETQSGYEAKILNEVIGLVNTLKSSNQYDGKSDPEGAYHFMNSLGRLAQAISKVNDRVASKIRIYEGKIALNLKNNPSFPQNAVEALSGPMIEMARGHAVRGERELAVKALQNAIDSGFGELESLSKDKTFVALFEDADQHKQFMVGLETRYKKAVDSWSRKVIASFQPMSFEFDVNDIQGGRIAKSDFRGKVLVVDLWATWCPPCRKGIPHYIKLQNEYRDDGVAVVGISMDNPNDPYSALQTVRDFASTAKFNYVCGIGDNSINNMLPGKSVLPTTVFIDRNGTVRYIARGYHDYAKVEALTRVLASENQMVGTGMPISN